MGSTKQNIVKFSYDLVSLKPYPCDDTNYWKVIEKGSKKSKKLKKHTICFDTLKSARYTLNVHPNMETSPCYKSLLLRDQGFDIYLKREEENQPLQSVKARGVMYTLLKLSEEQKHKGVIAISTGSFAYILGYYGDIFDIPVTVVMPATVAAYHVKKCQDIGSLATVVVHGNDILEAHSYALELAQLRGLFYLDRNDHPNMIIGQATFGLDIINKIENVDVVILPTAINDCGLTAGIAMAIKGQNPKITIVKVKATDCDPLVEKIRSQTMSEHELTIPVAKYRWDQSSKLSEQILFDYHIRTNKEAIATAVRILHVTERVSDYYTAIGLAPIVGGELNMLKGKRVVIPVFGEMDMAMGLPTLRSGPSVPRAGPSTSSE